MAGSNLEKMDIHAFIEGLIDDQDNRKLVKDIAESFKVLRKKGDNLILKIPAKPRGKKSKAKYIHGNIFEEYVLKAAVEDQRMKAYVIGKNEAANVNEKFQEIEKKFNGIYGTMETAYKDTMIKAGSDAWGILSEIFANHLAPGDTELAFEKTIDNNLTTLLTEKPRADLVAEIGEKVFIVDFKYSSKNQEEYEKTWLVNGLIQVLIYAILIGKDPVNLTLWVLVYYAREGQIVLYSTEKIRDNKCVNKLKEIAEIQDDHDDEDGEDDEDGKGDKGDKGDEGDEDGEDDISPRMASLKV